MENEVRTSAVVSILIIGVLAAAGIISYVIIKRRKEGNEGVDAGQEIMDSNISAGSHQKLMSTRSRHRKERRSLPVNSRRARFSRFRSSGQQSSSINDERGDSVTVFVRQARGAVENENQLDQRRSSAVKRAVDTVI
uniref:Uncharacterized protein n=1 Tax=Setaria digitata TaxID=48799 RepID=A0A915PW89_9BILA